MNQSARLAERLVARGQCMQRVSKELEAMAPIDANVLLTGETGTGKGLAARLLHDLGPRSAAPFVHVDCAALAATLIESELFGHERGAFTSATHQYAGRFERAGSGTIFLDEIGDLELRLQAKLLRVLEDREYERVGGTKTLRLQARVIAATSRNLRGAVEENRFRADLYFRLGVFELEMPPLRDRLEDIPALTAHGVRQIAARIGRTPPVVTGELLAALERRSWPGNIRELMNVLERMMVIDRSNVLGTTHLPLAPQEVVSRANAENFMPHSGAATAYTLSGEVSDFERQEILDALDQSNGNVTAAARRLRIPRGTLRHKLRKHDLNGFENPEPA